MTWFEDLWQKKVWCPAHAQSLNTRNIPVDTTMTSESTGSPVGRRTRLFLFLAWAVVALGYIISYVALPYLPATIAIHWNIFGNADGFIDKIAGAFGLPLFMTVMMVLLTILPRFERMKGTFSLYRDIYAILVFCIAVFMFAIQMFTLLTGMGFVIPVMVFMPVMQGILFMVLGSLLPHVGRNSTMGFRLPWTLRDPVVWQRTHEYGSRFLIAAGALNLLCPLAGMWGLTLGIVIVLIAMGYVTIWSYRLAKSRTAEQEKCQESS
jgi:uncharacterized membrane protein